jgi:hypothetical protein
MMATWSCDSMGRVILSVKYVSPTKTQSLDDDNDNGKMRAQRVSKQCRNFNDG